jgi:hypothetical protein
MADEITLEKFFSRLLEEQDKRMTLRFDALDKALILNRGEMERRLEGMNQLRAEVLSDRGQFTLKGKCDEKHLALIDWQNLVNKKLTVLETRSITWTAAVGLFFLIISFVMRWIGK